MRPKSEHDYADRVAVIGLVMVAVLFVLGMAEHIATIDHRAFRFVWQGEAHDLRPYRSWIRIVAIGSASGAAVAVLIPSRVLRSRAICSGLIVVLLASVAGGLASTTVRRIGYKGHYFDAYDTYTYLLGPRYIDELGYERQYECAIVALRERGVPPPEFIRDLRTNHMLRGNEVVVSERAAECRQAFSYERWMAFSRDVAWYRQELGRRGFERVNTDHGYNGPPPLTATIRAIDPHVLSTSTLGWIGLANPLLLLVACTYVVRAFGWRLGLSFAAFLWASQVDMFLTISAFVRYWWLAALLTGLACLRARRYALAGAALAIAGAFKLFPLLFAVGVFAKLVHVWRRQSSVPRHYWAFAVSFVLSLGVLVLWGTWAGGGIEAWSGFLAQMELNSGRLSLGRIGFVFDFIFPKEVRHDVAVPFAERVAGLDELHGGWFSLTRLRLAITGTVIVWLAVVVDELDDTAAAIAVGFSLFFLCFPTVRYYYCGFVGLPLLWHARLEHGGYRVGTALVFAWAGMAYWLEPYVRTPFLFHTWYPAAFTVLIGAVLVVSTVTAVRRKAVGGGGGRNASESNPANTSQVATA